MSEDRDEVYDYVYNVARDQERIKDFASVKGLCRTCQRGFIRQREFDDVPEVICRAIYERPHRVPHDVMKCTDYRRRGEMDLREMTQVAVLIDKRVSGGQYL